MMNYSIEGERVGEPSGKVEEINDEIIRTLSILLEMDVDKISFFTKEMGLYWLDKPDLVGVTQEERRNIRNLQMLLRRIRNV